MRNGIKVFDCDTHLRPTVETIIPYLDPELREQAPQWGKVPVRIGMAGERYEAPHRHYFRFRTRNEGWNKESMRMLGQAVAPETGERTFQRFMGKKFPRYGGGDFDVEARIRDMDEERVEDSVKEIKKWSRSPWAVGVEPRLALDQPLDHPDLEPIWRAADEEGLCVVHHNFSFGFPGYRDLWDNRFIGRLASHPWGAMRAVPAFFGCGILDRYPNIRFGILESGFGWLPFWASRMDDQAVYIGEGAIPENIQHKFSEYMVGGRFFAGIVIHEGEKMAKMVTDFLGDHVLMYASYYPHAESRFPDSAESVLSWKSLGTE